MESVFGLHHVKSPLFQPWQIITHLFMHGNLLHLIYNMFALWMFGSELETIWGPKKFLTFYFLCGIGAALIQLLWLWFQWHELVTLFSAVKLNPNINTIRDFYYSVGLGESSRATALFQSYFSDPDNLSVKSQVIHYISNITYRALSEPTIGASGAVFGVLAGFVFLFPNRELYLYFLIGIKAKWVGLAYFGYEVFSAFQNNPNDNIAHWAHIGGGLVGFLLVLTWNNNNRRNRRNYFDSSDF